jgi:hypothetical protein
LVTLNATHGLRISEALERTPADLDTTRSPWVLHLGKRDKAGDRVQIELAEHVIEAIKAIPNWREQKWLFGTCSKDNVNRAVKRACEKAGVAFYGSHARARHALDIGRKRSPADILGLLGYHRTTRLASAARYMLALKNGYRGHRTTSAEIRHIVERHPELTRSTEQFDKSVGISPSMLAALHYTVRSPKLLNDPETAANTINTFQQGGQKYPGDPLHMFRERVIREVSHQRRPSPRRMFYGLVRFLQRVFRHTVSARRNPSASPASRPVIGSQHERAHNRTLEP